MRNPDDLVTDESAQGQTENKPYYIIQWGKIIQKWPESSQELDAAHSWRPWASEPGFHSYKKKAQPL